MWLENLKELKELKKMTYKQISEATKIPESTVKRLFSGDTPDPYVSTIHRIVTALGGSLDHVLADTGAIISRSGLVEAKEQAQVALAENDLLKEENASFRDKIAALEREIIMLKMQLRHKEELLVLHNHYNKLKQQEVCNEKT